MNCRIVSAELFPVIQLACEDILHLGCAQFGQRVFGMDNHSDPVDGESEGFQAVFLHLLLAQRTPGVADFNQPFTDFLHAHTRATGCHADADTGVGLHDAFGSLLHHRNMCCPAGDVDLAFHAGERIQFCGAAD